MKIVILIAVFMVLMITEAKQTQRMLLVSGHSGELPIMDLNGHSYVDLEALARVTNGSLSFNRNQTVLTLPGATSNPGATAAADHHRANAMLSKDFIRAGIEALSVKATRTRTYIRPDSLSNDPLDQRIMGCAHSLTAMAANGQFLDDLSCH